MAKTVIFNNQVYELDENKLAPINASMVEFLTTELAGTGATIKFNNTTYEVDGAKLSTSKSELVNFLGTIQGEGEVIEIDGVEYPVASSALEEANVTIAETLINLGIFSEGLEYELNEDGASYSVIGIGTCTDTDVIIPAEYEGLPVTELKPRTEWYEEKGELIETEIGTFQNCSNLTSVTIPNSVTSIGDRAFWYCTGLTSVTIPDSVTSIGFRAFLDCTSLTSVTIPDSVTRIDNYAFLGCKISTATIPAVAISAIPQSNLKEVVITTGNISSGAFAYCDSLTNVTLSSGVMSIGSRAFYECTSLTSVTIPDSVTSIGEYAFYSCDSLKYNEYNNGKYLGNSKNPYIILVDVIDTSATSFTIHNTTKFIHCNAFLGCTSLTSVTIPDSVKSIGEDAFYGCSSLNYTEYNKGRYLGNSNNPYFVLIEIIDNSATSFTIPNTTKIIYSSAFEDCTSLTSITIPDSVTSIGEYAFRGCTSLTSVYITDIAKWCAIDFSSYLANPLYHAKNLYLNGMLVTDLEIPNSVTSIGFCAFTEYTSLTSVTIPNSVTRIGDGAFNGCTGLTTVTIGNGITSIGDNVFSCGPEGSNITNIYINTPENSISGVPWGADNAIIHWNSTGPDAA